MHLDPSAGQDVAQIDRRAGREVHDLVQAHRRAAQPLKVRALPGVERRVVSEEEIDHPLAVIQPAVEQKPHVERRLAGLDPLIVQLVDSILPGAVELLVGDVLLHSQHLLGEVREPGQGRCAFPGSRGRPRAVAIETASLVLLSAATRARVVAAGLAHVGLPIRSP